MREGCKVVGKVDSVQNEKTGRQMTGWIREGIPEEMRL
jgi:hypothetical protein